MPAPLAQAIETLSHTLRCVSSFDDVLRLVEESCFIQLLILPYPSSDFDEKIFRKLRKRPEMIETLSLAIVSEENLKSDSKWVLGMDDFVLAHSSFAECLARLRKILVPFQKLKKLQEATFQIGSVDIFPSSQQVLRNGKDLNLTSLEFRLLLYLYKNRGKIVQRDELLHQVWGYVESPYTRTVDTYIKRLRRKLGEEGEWIETLRGLGYRLRDLPLSTHPIHMGAGD